MKYRIFAQPLHHTDIEPQHMANIELLNVEDDELVTEICEQLDLIRDCVFTYEEDVAVQQTTSQSAPLEPNSNSYVDFAPSAWGE